MVVFFPIFPIFRLLMLQWSFSFCKIIILSALFSWFLSTHFYISLLIFSTVLYPTVVHMSFFVLVPLVCCPCLLIVLKHWEHAPYEGVLFLFCVVLLLLKAEWEVLFYWLQSTICIKGTFTFPYHISNDFSDNLLFIFFPFIPSR